MTDGIAGFTPQDTYSEGDVVRFNGKCYVFRDGGFREEGPSDAEKTCDMIRLLLKILTVLVLFGIAIWLTACFDTK